LRDAAREIDLEVYADQEKAGPDRVNYIEIIEKNVSARIMARAHLQIIQPGVVSLPRHFVVKSLGEYGLLKVTMPSPALLAATKLARGETEDIADVSSWMTEHLIWGGLEPTPSLHQIRAAIDTLPKPAKREAAIKALSRLQNMPSPPLHR
jgi:hypothetical protein